MDNIIHMTLAQQIFLYLPLIDLLECKYVSKMWLAQISRVFKRTLWLHPQTARKMASAVSSIVGGAVVQRLHVHSLYSEMTKMGYKLNSCVPHKGLIFLMFQELQQAVIKRKYRFCVVSRHNVNEVIYMARFEGRFGDFYTGSRYLLVIWWYTLISFNHIKLHYIIVDDLINFTEKRYTTSILLSDFVSPVVALHRLYSGDNRIQRAIKV